LILGLERDKMNLNSMLYWYEQTKDLEIPQPKTFIYKIPEEFLNIFYEEQFPEGLLEEIYPITEELGFPLFLRTDYSSIKHNYEKTCFVDSKTKLEDNIYNVIEGNILADYIGFPFKALIFREFIELEYKFKAFKGNLPIAKERRYFINNREIQCYHPYWPIDTIKNPSLPNYKELLSELNKQSEDEIKLLSKYSLMVAEVLDSYYNTKDEKKELLNNWSVDFAKGINGLWYLIDIAIGERSFHWLSCVNCPPEMKRDYANKIK
jgi:hypothetical protein